MDGHYLGLLSGGGTADPRFTGEKATAEYEAAAGVTNSGGVPVEQDGGQGTRDSHWDEETFDNEIMTGYINNSDNFLSSNNPPLKRPGHPAAADQKGTVYSLRSGLL